MYPSGTGLQSLVRVRVGLWITRTTNNTTDYHDAALPSVILSSTARYYLTNFAHSLHSPLFVTPLSLLYRFNRTIEL